MATYLLGSRQCCSPSSRLGPWRPRAAAARLTKYWVDPTRPPATQRHCTSIVSVHFLSNSPKITSTFNPPTNLTNAKNTANFVTCFTTNLPIVTQYKVRFYSGYFFKVVIGKDKLKHFNIEHQKAVFILPAGNELMDLNARFYMTFGC